jgi:VanZ family protein
VLNKKTVLILAICWTIIITILSLVTIGNVGGSISIPNKDKIVHFIFYFTFVVLWIYYKQNNQYNTKISVIIVLIAIGYGAIMEIFQGIFTTTRCPDFIDFLANSSGAIVGMFAIKKYLTNKKSI